jgi:bifunctional DNase/RNase
MEKIKLEIVGLSYSQTQSGAYALVLGESEGKRRLPIVIGGFEAQAIAIELEKMTPSRPLTHDLFKSMAKQFDISIKEILVYNFAEGIFYAKIVCSTPEKEVEIDARTSDAIALAVRFGCPIFTYEFILSSAGVLMDDESIRDSEKIEDDESLEEEDEPIAKKSAEDIPSINTSELEKKLNEAIANEEYERASRIRDELNNRKK